MKTSYWSAGPLTRWKGGSRLSDVVVQQALSDSLVAVPQRSQTTVPPPPPPTIEVPQGTFQSQPQQSRPQQQQATGSTATETTTSRPQPEVTTYRPPVDTSYLTTPTPEPYTPEVTTFRPLSDDAVLRLLALQQHQRLRPSTQSLFPRTTTDHCSFDTTSGRPSCLFRTAGSRD